MSSIEYRQLTDGDQDIIDNLEEDDHKFDIEEPILENNHNNNNNNVLFDTFKILVLIILWYLFSISISIYNKWMFSPSYLDFKYPILTTSGHQLVQLLFASIITRASGHTNPLTQYKIKEYLKNIGPCAIASSGDIGLANVSLTIVSLTFYTMVKSSNLGFVLIFGILFQLEKPNIKLTSIIIAMTIGVIMMVSGEAEFKLIGFLMVLGAAMFSGLRWTLTQLLLKTNERVNHNPITTILLLSPLMFIILFLLGLIIEHPLQIAHSQLFIQYGVIRGIMLIILPGILAFAMTLSEFYLLNNTSVLTLSIAGIFKELVTIFISWIVFKDKLSVVNIIGLFITLTTIISYNVYRFTKQN